MRLTGDEACPPVGGFKTPNIQRGGRTPSSFFPPTSVASSCFFFSLTSPAPLREIIEYLSFGGSMVTRLKLKGIDGRAHQEWSLRLNLTQHGKTHQVQTVEGLTD